MQDIFPEADQFNSIHERLIGAWKYFHADRVHLGGLRSSLEDQQTVLYIADTGHQAGIAIQQLAIEDAGFDRMNNRFVDLEGIAKHFPDKFKSNGLAQNRSQF